MGSLWTSIWAAFRTRFGLTDKNVSLTFVSTETSIYINVFTHHFNQQFHLTKYFASAEAPGRRKRIARRGPCYTSVLFRRSAHSAGHLARSIAHASYKSSIATMAWPKKGSHKDMILNTSTNRFAVDREFVDIVLFGAADCPNLCQTIHWKT